MSNSWVPVPRLPPMRCRATSLSGPEHGPYFEEALVYCEPGGDDRELTGYLSAEWLRQVCSSPGSPFALVDRAEREADEAHVRALTARAEADRALVEALRERIADLEARLEAVPPPIDAAALAAELAPALAPALDERFARKPGPRRKAA